MRKLLNYESVITNLHVMLVKYCKYSNNNEINRVTKQIKMDFYF